MARSKETQEARFRIQENDYFEEIANIKSRLVELPKIFKEEKKQLEEQWRLKLVRNLNFKISQKTR